METSADIFFISVIRGDPFSRTLVCISKIYYFVQKKSQNAGVNRAEKVTMCLLNCNYKQVEIGYSVYICKTTGIHSEIIISVSPEI